jgi:hypothetical protein
VFQQLMQDENSRRNHDWLTTGTPRSYTCYMCQKNLASGGNYRQNIFYCFLLCLLTDLREGANHRFDFRANYSCANHLFDRRANCSCANRLQSRYANCCRAIAQCHYSHSVAPVRDRPVAQSHHIESSRGQPARMALRMPRRTECSS